jgi:hypothetical protein
MAKRRKSLHGLMGIVNQELFSKAEVLLSFESVWGCIVPLLAEKGSWLALSSSIIKYDFIWEI